MNGDHSQGHSKLDNWGGGDIHIFAFYTIEIDCFYGV